MIVRVQASVQDRVLRCLPPLESGESMRVDEISAALGISGSHVQSTLRIAMKRGLVVRIRFGYYARAVKS